MAVIFYFSSQSNLPSSPDPFIEVAVKKSAHAAEYAILSLLLWRALVKLWPLETRRAAIFAWLIAALFAVSDEFHQSFTPSRTPNPTDVLIDVAAAAVAMIAILRLASRTRAP